MRFRLSYDFHIDTELLQLRFVPGTMSQGYLHRRGTQVTITMPSDFDWRSAKNQEWANHVLAEALRSVAKQVFPQKVAALAQQYQLRYNRVFIKDVSTRWGSCSQLGNINLSLWLLLAPEDLVDYVIKHELAHLNEMNHSPRFWAEVDKMTGGPGTAKALERRMKGFSKNLVHLRYR